MGRKDWTDKDTKVRGKGKVAKRQQDLKLGSAAKKSKKTPKPRVFDEPKEEEIQELRVLIISRIIIFEMNHSIKKLIKNFRVCNFQITLKNA